MREIKFKVWNGEKMLGPFDLSQNPIYWEGLEDGERLLYTGSNDNEGNEIYECDILEFNNNDYLRTGGNKQDKIMKGHVEFVNGMFLIICVGNEFDLYEVLVNDEECKIIGNVYEYKEV